MYRPLPPNVTIKNSEIEGLGLFATDLIPKWEEIGVTHRIFGETINRTPLGGFYNHSDDPNCVKKKGVNEATGITTYKLCSLREIQPGEELTVRYTFYNVKE